MKILLTIVLSIIGLVISAYLLLLVINLNDQPVSEIAKQLEQSFISRTHLHHGKNAYVYAIGFSAPKDIDPQVYGTKRIKRVCEIIEKNTLEDFRSDPTDSSDKFLRNRAVEVEELSEACKSVNPECINLLKSSGLTIDKWLGSERWLLDRYTILTGKKGWYEPYPHIIELPLPPYQVIFEGQKLLYVYAWQLTSHGNSGAIKNLLNDDALFWRHVLENTDSLITKMIAIEALKRHYTWSNIILKKLGSDMIGEAIPDTLTKPFTSLELSMKRILTNEWKFLDRTLKNSIHQNENLLFGTYYWDEPGLIDGYVWRLLMPLLQRVDTSNRFAELMHNLGSNRFSSDDLFQNTVQRGFVIERQYLEANRPIKNLYNFTGSLLLSFSSTDITNYTIRVADIEGLRRAVYLAASLRSQGVIGSHVAEKLNNVQSSNPYTGKPFEWDSVNMAIVYTGFEHGDRGKYILLY